MIDPFIAARTALDAERRRLAREISVYPTPISGCDAQFNHLIDLRAHMGRALAELDCPEPIPTSRQPL